MANPPSVRTAGDWMTLFTGSRGGAAGPGASLSTGSASLLSSGSGSRFSPPSSTLNSRYSPPADYSRYSSRDTRHDDYTSGSTYSTGSRYSRSTGLSSRSGITSPTPTSSSRIGSVSSPPSSRRTYSSHSLASYRYLSEDTDRKVSRYRDEVSSLTQTPSTASRNNQNSDTEDGRRTNKKPGMVVLNQGAVMIKRSGRAANTSDEESDSDEEKIEPLREPSQPPRDPLEVEEEELTQKLQTAAFLMSLPEEESIKRRLLEVKQMRENPEFFKLENTRGFKFTNISSQVAKPNTARIEEEKILVLRLNSRGITEVEQTDVLVRLQEIWRDRMEELESGSNKLEQEYEHHLTETSTETSELDGSIRGKQGQVAKLQEEILVLSIKKDKVSEDMEKVTSTHLAKMDDLKTELRALQDKSSEYSVMKISACSKKESCLPEDERSEIESELECPVCLEISRPPIYQCGEGHIICSSCKPLLKACSLCECKYADPPIRCRFAEKLADKYFKLDDD